MGFIYRIGHNNATKSGIYLPGNIPLSNGSATGSISSEGTRYLNCANKVPYGNISIGSDTLHCSGKRMSGNISIESVTAPYLSWASVGGYLTGQCCIYWSVGAADGVIVRRSGTVIYTGTGSSYEISSGNWVTGYIDSGLSVGSTYYYTVQPYRTYFGSTWYGYESSSMSYYAASYSVGETTFTSSQYWPCPTGVRTLQVFLVGGGGGGGRGGTGYWSTCGGGGAGGYTSMGSVSVVPGASYLVTVGGGGGSDAGGGTSSFGSLISAGGGGCGGPGADEYYDTGGYGGSGGSGGGGGSGEYRSGSDGGASGGYNGSDGSGSETSIQGPGGSGQHTTTRKWHNDVSGVTMYSTGAHGGYSYTPGSETANTGNGARGGCHNGAGGTGGSGIVIIKT